MQKLLITTSNYLKGALPAIMVTVFICFLLFSKKPAKVNNRDAELKALAAKQDSVLEGIKKTELILQFLAIERKELYDINDQLLKKQNYILSNIKTLQNEYSKIDKINLDRAAIYQFYIDSCKTYTAY